MGQAAVDLPDPLATAPAPASPAASADDLLSQLAGEEIDRMLAEADASPPAGENAPPAPSMRSEDPARAATSLQPLPTSGDAALAATSGQTTPQIATVGPSMTPPNAWQTHKANETVGNVFTPDGEVKQAALPEGLTAHPNPPTESLETPPLTAADQAAIDEMLSAQVATPEAEPSKVAAAPSEDVGTSPAERSALEGVTAALDAHGDTDDNAPDAPTEQSGLPIYLMPLQWISLPLMIFPASVRELVGKIAILTLFNAIAVIIYVLMFRH